MTIIHAYVGTDPNSTDYNLNLDPPATYQDVITTFLLGGGQSGQIFDLEGNEVVYTDPISLPEVNYLISDGEFSTVSIRNLEGQIVNVTYPVNGYVRDIFNQSLALGFGWNVRLVLPDEDAPANTGIKITFILAQGSKKEVPTLITGKYFPLETPVHLLQLDPGKTIHLVKYHVAFACEYRIY